MAKYLWQVSYSAEGVRGLLKEGGTSRRAFVEQIVKEAGGTVCDSAGQELHYNKADLHNPEFFVLPAADQTLRAQVQAYRSKSSKRSELLS